MFWRTLKSTLTPAIVSGLEDRRIHLYDEILFFWDVLPQMRPEIAELMPLFEQSRENSARRGGYEREEMKKMVRNFCLLRIMDPSAVQKGETAVCLRILEYLSYGKTSETSVRGTWTLLKTMFRHLYRVTQKIRPPCSVPN